MIQNIRHPVVALIIFAISISLALLVYNDGLVAGYDIEEGGLNANNESVAGQLNNLLIIDGISSSIAGIYTLKDPTGNLVDVVGALTSVGIGALKVLVGIFTVPFEILSIVSEYYAFPSIIAIGFPLIITVYIALIILGAYLSGGKF